MRIIALVGAMGSGKDTVGRHLVETHGFIDIAFADALKDVCAAIFCWDREMLSGRNPQSRAWRDEVDTWWAERLGIPQFTPRWALQNIGTECLRGHFHDDLWMLNVERKIAEVQEQHGSDSRVVLTDARFPLEFEMVNRQANGEIVRVKRGPEPEWARDAHLANTPGHEEQIEALQRMKARGVHISEWAWMGQPTTHVLDNSSTLDDLFRQTDQMLG